MAGAWAPHALSAVESAQSERDRRPPYISLLCVYIRKRPSFAKSSNMFFHIKQHLILIIFCEIATNVQATVKSHSVDSIKKSLEEHQGHLLVNKSKTNSVPLKIANVSQIGYDPPKKKKKNDTFKPITLQLWVTHLESLYIIILAHTPVFWFFTITHKHAIYKHANFRLYNFIVWTKSTIRDSLL